MAAPAPSGPRVNSGREVIHIQVGQAGNEIGHEFWRDLCDEHRIEYHSSNEELRGAYHGDNRIYEDKLDVFFNEGSKGSMGKLRWVPRCILVDLNDQDLAMVTQNSLGSLYRPENIICTDEGSGNCYARAYYTEGPPVADRVLETVRKEAERCSCLQGVQFTHAISGGTGSGLNSLILRTLYDYFDRGSKCILQSFTLVPAPRQSHILIEPYNAALALQDLSECCHQVYMFDNVALTEICQKALQQDTPKMKTLNNLVALCMSNITSCLRFSGPLNADLRKQHTNLVPFEVNKFLISGLAPLTAPTSKAYRRQSAQDLAQQMISQDSCTVKCDPLNPGDEHAGVLKARFLASWASWRGDFKTQEVDQICYDLQKPGSRYDKFFPDWIPNSIASNVCKVPHTDMGNCVTMVSNNTAVHDVFDNICRSWDKMYKNKAYFHVYEQDGISTEDMMSSRRSLEYISEAYCECARYADKLVQDGEGRPARGSDQSAFKAVTNPEQQRIAEELYELAGNGMFLSEVDARMNR